MKNAIHPSAPSASSFKYHSTISAISNCPPSASGSPLSVSYRFCHADLKHPSNTLPIAEIHKNSLPPRRPNCSSYALSMFVSLETLKARAKAGISNSPQFLKKIGDHYVKIELSSTAGRQTVPNSDGHFDLHEYASFNLHAAVQEHRQLVL